MTIEVFSYPSVFPLPIQRRSCIHGSSGSTRPSHEFSWWI